jgi:hypothetical protein
MNPSGAAGVTSRDVTLRRAEGFMGSNETWQTDPAGSALVERGRIGRWRGDQGG